MFPPRVRKGRLRSEERCTETTKEKENEISSLSIDTQSKIIFAAIPQLARAYRDKRLDLQRKFYYCHCHDFCLLTEVILLALRYQKLICSANEVKRKLERKKHHKIRFVRHHFAIFFIKIRVLLFYCCNFFLTTSLAVESATGNWSDKWSPLTATGSMVTITFCNL